MRTPSYAYESLVVNSVVKESRGGTRFKWEDDIEIDLKYS
jgi:hypothetical protein